MSKARVPLFGQPRNFVNITPEATVGATIGVNLYNADGTLFDPSTLTGSSTTIVNGMGYAHDKRTGNAITINASDDKKIIELTFAGAITITVSGLIPFSRGFDFIVFCSGSGGQATFAGTNGMVISSPDSLKTRTLYSPVGLMVDDTNEATLYGDIEPVSPALSVLARALNSIGAPAFLVAAANGQVLRRFGDVLAFSNVLASEVTNTPAGNIASTTVQTAINELDTKKAPVVHTHVSTDVTNFNSASRAQTEAELVAGANVTITPSGSGATRQLTIASSGGGGAGVTAGDKGDITIASGADGDYDFNSVTSLLHFDGADGSTTFTDIAGSIWTAIGNAQIDTAQFLFGSASVLLDGAGDYITTPSSTSFDIGTADFTIEAWVRLSASGFKRTLFCRQTLSPSDIAFQFNIQTSNVLEIILRSNDGTTLVTTTSTATIGTGAWVHVAATRDSGVVRLFIDGALDGSTSGNTQNLTPVTPCLISIGAFQQEGTLPNNYVNGWIDDFRFTKGIARYKVAFIPPTIPYYDSLPKSIDGDHYFANVSSLLHFNGADASTTFADVKGKVWTANGNAQIDTTVSKYGGASGLFDGASDYLTTSASSDFAFGTGDFTVEMWLYVNPSTSAWSRAIEFQLFNANGGGHMSFNGTDSAGVRRLGWQQGNAGGGGDRLESNSAFPTNVWTHYAVSRQGNITRAFVGGVLQSATITASGRAQDNLTNTACVIASAVDFTNGYMGRIDDLRITKGVARYTKTFTPESTAFYDNLPSYSTWDIDSDAVTFAKMQNINTNKLLGRSTAGIGDIEEITLGTNLTLVAGVLNASGGSSPLDTTLTYIGDKLDVVTTASGTKTMGYTGDKLTSIVGTGIYPSKNFSYTGDLLTGIDVL